MVRGTFQMMKSVNKSTILNKIRQSGPISRAEIAKVTGITPPTVSSIVKELMDEKLVVESNLGESQGGRKPTMLLLNRNEHYVVGVDAGSDSIKACVSDLVGNILVRSELPIKSHTIENFLAVLIQAIQLVIKDMGIEGNKVIGIGIAMHGVVDVATGTSLYSANSGLRNVHIKEVLEDTFDLQVRVENNSRAMALGEYWFGDYGTLKSFTVINIGRGVGSGMIESGKLRYGAQEIAGEIGHMTISLDGEKCSCGNQGCFETFVTGDAIVRRAKIKIPDAPEELTGEKVYEYALEGKKEYQKILEETGVLIGIGIVNLIHSLNPEKIVLGGGVMKSHKFLMPSIIATIQQRALTEKARKDNMITLTRVGDDATILGAAALLLTKLF
ncbi:ROK family transcriptional regulator [Desemzia sp. RIT804]|uniref:ROK family transcriptional regulator n=1 Tax=Desemzia sp. RIT 804 TaxID=2810209 RepID=UPI001950988D|nr:ROK family transcriptional regulator [Desemzia sp. RIT 804]MBM6614772.1 ROK family transcriptional regulator [Desemzia sp. RIT 804]